MLRQVSPAILGYNIRLEPASVEFPRVFVKFIKGRALAERLPRQLNQDETVQVNDFFLAEELELSALVTLTVEGILLTYETPVTGNGMLTGSGDVF